MATYSLSGSGNQSLSAGVTAVHVDVTTVPTNAGSGSAFPANLYHVALLRWGDAVGYFDAVPVVGGPQWLAVPAGTTRLGYACQFGAVISVAEVIGGTPPFGGAGALSTLSDVALASPADTQVLTYQASSSKWINAAASGGGGGGGMAHIGTTTLTSSSATITFSSIPGTYRHLFFDGVAKADAGGTGMQVMNTWLNGDTTTTHYNNDGTANSNRIGVLGNAGGYALRFNGTLYNYTLTSPVAHTFAAFSQRTDSSAIDPDVTIWTPTSGQAVTQVQFLPTTGNFAAGTIMTCYGLPT